MSVSLLDVGAGAPWNGHRTASAPGRTYCWTTAAVIRSAGAVVAVATLFSALANWGWNTGVFPVPPLAAMMLVVLCAGAALLLDRSHGMSLRFVLWAAGNGLVAMAAFLWSSGSDVALQETQTRVLSSALLVGLTALMSDPLARRVARVAIVIGAIGATAMHLWETTHPLAFSMALGRSAGFHVNPNIAGAALIAGMLLGLPAVPARFRELYVLLCGVGVLTTLSRGALLCWAVTVGLLGCWRAVRASRLFLTFGVGAIAGVSLAGALLASGELGYIAGGAERFVRQRLSLGSAEELSADGSASSRVQLAMHALEMFGERPMTGHGVGATVEWGEPESTHNVYVRQLAEYGFAGAWLAPALLLLGWRAAGRNGRTEGEHAEPALLVACARTFVVFVALWGLFSHNVLDDAFVLIGLALVAAGSARSSRNDAHVLAAEETA